MYTSYPLKQKRFVVWLSPLSSLIPDAASICSAAPPQALLSRLYTTSPSLLTYPLQNSPPFHLVHSFRIYFPLHELTKNAEKLMPSTKRSFAVTYFDFKRWGKWRVF